MPSLLDESDLDIAGVNLTDVNDHLPVTVRIATTVSDGIEPASCLSVLTRIPAHLI
jgi:hypothetical protein